MKWRRKIIAKSIPNVSSKKQLKTASSDSASKYSATERQQMIAEAAYFIAENRHFTAGNELGDWLQAEHEIEAISLAQ